jgi:hypothetical protein
MPRCGAALDENVGGALRAAISCRCWSRGSPLGTAPPTFRLFSKDRGSEGQPLREILNISLRPSETCILNTTRPEGCQIPLMFFT